MAKAIFAGDAVRAINDNAAKRRRGRRRWRTKRSPNLASKSEEHD